MNISKSSNNNLKCICGLCDHDFADKSCLYNKMIDDADPNKKMYNLILAIIKKEVNNATVKSKSTTAKKRPKQK